MAELGPSAIGYKPQAYKLVECRHRRTETSEGEASWRVPVAKTFRRSQRGRSGPQPILLQATMQPHCTPHWLSSSNSPTSMPLGHCHHRGASSQALRLLGSLSFRVRVPWSINSSARTSQFVRGFLRSRLPLIMNADVRDVLLRQLRLSVVPLICPDDGEWLGHSTYEMAPNVRS